ncbi:MAG: pyruvate carboxylase subunit B [Burkholderiaceae bacterium]|nr:pyruvate carboxylase subunit B [Burkholderiaceae bacterium]
MKEIRIVDTTLRDAHQCLWATRMTTAMMLPVAETMDRIGFDTIDLAGHVQFDVCIRYLKENPWERVRLMRERVRNAPLRGFMRSKGYSFTDIMPDDLNDLMVERMVANGFGAIVAFDGLSDPENIVRTLLLTRKLGARAIGCLAYSLSPVHTDELYVRMAEELVRRNAVDAIMIKDSGGLLTVDRIRTLVPAVRKAIGSTTLELHSHCITGLAPLVYLEGAKLGVDQIHTSIAPLANGIAQPSTQAMARDLRSMGFDVPIDDALVDEVSRHFQRVAEQEGKPVGVPLEYDATHYHHQVPGGMRSNFESSLAEAGLGHRLQEVLEECARVREELGWPMLITPFAQLVGTQALLNVIRGDRYSVVPDAVKKYALGYYGRLLAPVKPDVLDRIITNGSPAIAMTPTPPDPVVPALRKAYPNMSDEERLLRFMFPGSQVDEMLAQRPTATTYHFEKPVVRLLRELSQRPRKARIVVTKGSDRLELGATGQPSH